LPTDNAVEIFYSYSHRDEDLREELEKQLSLLKKRGLIRTWHDRKIEPGTEWDRTISNRLNSADIILLLISADFLSSDYCYDIEMTRAMERHEAREARVIPIILRHVDNWQAAPFGKLQALPKGGKPVKSWTDRDEAFADIARGIRSTIEALGQPSEPADEEPPNQARIDDSSVPRLLPYMCDRSDQEAELIEALHNHQATMPRRPFAFIIHGDQKECHSEFLERLKDLTLPRALNLESKGLSLAWHSMDWPSSGVQARRYPTVFTSNLSATLGLKLGSSVEEIVKHVAAHEKPLLITSHLFNDNFLGGGPDLLAAFFKYWDAFPDLPPGRLLMSCVSLKHEPLDQKGFFEKWKLQSLNKKLRSYLASVDFSKYPGLSGVVLSELQAIRRSDVETWRHSQAVRAICDIEEKEIRTLYERVELCTPDGYIRMERLADELRNLVGRKRHQRN
jgi:hypothetical protein